MVREHSQATFESYDGVRLRLETGYVIETKPFTVTEAVHFLRMIDGATEDPSRHTQFFDEFPARMGITGAKLAELGLAVLPLDMGELRFPEAIAFEKMLADATLEMDLRARSKAQLQFLETFPKAFGESFPECSPAEVFELGQKFIEAFYLLIYGLAQSFCYHLIPGPGNRVETTGARSSTSASTT